MNVQLFCLFTEILIVNQLFWLWPWGVNLIQCFIIWAFFPANATAVLRLLFGPLTTILRPVTKKYCIISPTNQHFLACYCQNYPFLIHLPTKQQSFFCFSFYLIHSYLLESQPSFFQPALLGVLMFTYSFYPVSCA